MGEHQRRACARTREHPTFRTRARAHAHAPPPSPRTHLSSPPARRGAAGVQLGQLSETGDVFSDLSLTVRGAGSLLEALAAYTRPAPLTGRDRYRSALTLRRIILTK